MAKTFMYEGRPRLTEKTCNRRDCQFNCLMFDNRCEILSTLYSDNMKCAWYKAKETKDGIAD